MHLGLIPRILIQVVLLIQVGSAAFGQPDTVTSVPQGKSEVDYQRQLNDIRDALQRMAASVEATKDEGEAKRREQREIEALAAQWHAANWAGYTGWTAIAALVGTSVGVFLVWRTLIHTRRAANAASAMLTHAAQATQEARNAVLATQTATQTTERIGKAQAKAYIAISDCQFMIDPTGGTPTIRFNYRNAGQSPARKIRIEAVVDYQNPMRMLHKHQAFRDDLSVGETREIIMAFPEWSKQKVPAFANSNCVYIGGSVEYQDVFNETSVVDFQYWLWSSTGALPTQFEDATRPPW